MARLAVKLLLVDADDQVLLIRSKDPRTQAECWYPVGGGVEAGESLHTAAAREAYEETGLANLPAGVPVWSRDHTYEFGGRTLDVHEEWLLHRVDHYTPRPAELTEYESRTILGFHWWRAGFVVRDEVAWFDVDREVAVVEAIDLPAEGHAVDLHGERLDLDRFEDVLAELVAEKELPPVTGGPGVRHVLVVRHDPATAQAPPSVPTT